MVQKLDFQDCGLGHLNCRIAITWARRLVFRKFFFKKMKALNLICNLFEITILSPNLPLARDTDRPFMGRPEFNVASLSVKQRVQL